MILNPDAVATRTTSAEAEADPEVDKIHVRHGLNLPERSEQRAKAIKKIKDIRNHRSLKEDLNSVKDFRLQSFHDADRIEMDLNWFEQVQTMMPSV